MSKNYYNIFQMIDDIFSDMANVSLLDNQPSRYNKAISSASFPPANLSVNNKTKELTIEVALAGCSEKDINLSFDADYLKLVVDRNTGDKNLKEGETATEYVIQRGLKVVDKAEVSWLIDPRYYDRETVKVTFENGLLVIKVYPRSEVAPKKISLFGGLAEKQIEEKKEE